MGFTRKNILKRIYYENNQSEEMTVEIIKPNKDVQSKLI